MLYQMQFKRFALLCALVVPGSLAAQQSSDLATIGNFDVSFEGVVYDGAVTEFTYCVTGREADKFHALSNWILELDLRCIGGDDLLTCGPLPCFYQEDDPNHVLTGIKFDDTEVEIQETKCYSFTLDGDWTDSLGETTLGLKAGNTTAVGGITGPICLNCEGFVRVDPTLGGVNITVEMTHKRPPTAITTLKFALFNESGVKLYTAETKPIVFEYGDTFAKTWFMSVPNHAPPGEYTLEMGIKGMAGWFIRRSTFQIP